MALLKTFATMALISGALLVLLPEGSLRRTAALVVGLMLTLCWAGGLMELARLPEPGPLPSAVLTPTGTTLQTAAEEAVRRLLPEVTQAP